MGFPARLPPSFWRRKGAAITTSMMEADHESEDRNPVSEEKDVSASCCCFSYRTWCEASA